MSRRNAPETFRMDAIDPQTWYSGTAVEALFNISRHTRYKILKQGNVTPRYLPGNREPVYSGFELRRVAFQALGVEEVELTGNTIIDRLLAEGPSFSKPPPHARPIPTPMPTDGPAYARKSPPWKSEEDVE